MNFFLRYGLATFGGCFAAPVGAYCGGYLASHYRFHRPSANGGPEMIVVGLFAICSGLITGVSTFAMILNKI